MNPVEKLHEYDENHPLWDRAVAHAKVVLQRSPAERDKSLAKGRWTEDRLPTVEELAKIILCWVDENNLEQEYRRRFRPKS